ncbi:MAG: acyltransferase [Bacteroidetes bacterium]|nr:acyltransferase [Bacteroidota bacterium]MBS1929728.1 acyltransferase [Bacteroidota bacterium]
MPAEKYNNDIPSLTGVRFVLGTMVFLLHYSGSFFFLGNFSVGVFSQFYLGVNMFFVLSGFVICYKYYEYAVTKRHFLLNYYLKRFSRIYPVFFMLTGITYLVWAMGNDTNRPLFREWLLNISFIKGFSDKYFLSGIGPSWSLSVEEVFYFFSPFIFILIKKKNIFFSQIIFWWLIGGLLLAFFSYIPFEGFFENSYFVYFVTFFGRCFEFYCGIFLAILIMGKSDFIRLKIPSFSFPFFTIAGIFWIIAGILLLYYNEYAWGYSLTKKVLLSNIFFPIGVSLFYLGLIKEKSVLQKLFSTKAFQLLGKSSYAFYLLHAGIIASGIEKYITQNVFLLFVLLQLVSMFIFLLFEKPVNKWIRNNGTKFLGRHT